MDAWNDRTVRFKRLLTAFLLALCPLLSGQVVEYACEADEILDQSDPAQEEHMGQSIAVGGDFNGDGKKDIVMGGYKRLQAGAGDPVSRVFVFLGTGNSVTSGQPLFRHRLTITGEGNQGVSGHLDMFGFSVAFIGDMNNDGCDELVVGSPRHNGDELTESGRVSIFLGSDALDETDATFDPETDEVLAVDERDLSFDGTVDGGWFGAAVATAQDSNGAFLRDLLIGAPGNGPVETSDINGTVYQVESPTIDDAAIVAGGSPGVAITASSATGTPGVAGSPTLGYTLTAHRLLHGDDPGDRFGHAVAFVGNLDGVSGQEFLVGAPQYAGEIGPPLVTMGPGYARLFDLDSATPLLTVSGTQTPSGTPRLGGEALGFSVAGEVDLDGDSDPDLIIGSPLFDVDVDGMSDLVDAGRAQALSGASAASGVEDAIDAFEDGAPNDTLLIGESGSGQFGCAVTGVDDVDGDFLGEVLVGAWLAPLAIATGCDPSETRTAQGGSARLFSPSAASPEIPLVIFYGEIWRDHLGRAVAAGHLFGTSAKPEIVLSGLAFSNPALHPLDETGRGYVWNGDEVAP
jgi:hypothetical protein